MWQLVLEGCHYAAASHPDQVFALLHHLGGHNIVVVKSRDLYLYSLNTVATDESNLSVAFTLESRPAKFKPDDPFDLRLKVRVGRVQDHVLDIEAA